MRKWDTRFWTNFVFEPWIRLLMNQYLGLYSKFCLAHGRLDRLSLYEKLLAQIHRRIIMNQNWCLQFLCVGCNYPAFILHQDSLTKSKFIITPRMIPRILSLSTNLHLFRNRNEQQFKTYEHRWRIFFRIFNLSKELTNYVDHNLNRKRKKKV